MISLPMAMTTFDEWLTAENKKRNWSQADLARKSGLSAPTISRLMTTVRKPGPDACAAIARAYGYPLDAVYRAAGLLQAERGAVEGEDLIAYLFAQLPEADREELLEIAQLKVARRKTAKPPGTPKAKRKQQEQPRPDEEVTRRS
jgi:transcriptional regulator with XRE-family HTH domain